MDQERFDSITRTLGSGLSRRGLLGAGAALVALLAATPVAVGKVHPGKHHAGNSQPGKGQLGSGQNGSPGPSPNCSRCEETYDGCVEPCAGESNCLGRCQNDLNICNAQCPSA